MLILIFGPQASGKGTQADLLADGLGVPHFSMGERLREEIERGSTIGKEIEPIMARGDLIPASLTNTLVQMYLEEHPEGAILDGYPRNAEQAAFLDGIASVDKVLHIHVRDRTSIERIAGRRECPQGHDYHLKYKPPQQEGICDLDGSPLRKRDDDTEEAIRHRLELYHAQTEPLLTHYAGRIIDVDGEQPIEKVHADIMAALGIASQS